MNVGAHLQTHTSHTKVVLLYKNKPSLEVSAVRRLLPLDPPVGSRGIFLSKSITITEIFQDA